MTVQLLDAGQPLATGDAAIRRAAERLRAGEVVAIPTDTVYGLAAALDRPAAMGDVFRIKGRPDERPLPILVADDATVGKLLHPDAAELSSTLQLLSLATTFWPGGLTVALPAHPDIPTATRAADGTAGFRVPADEVARRLLAEAGGALAVTSANPSGAPTPADPLEIARILGAGQHALRWVLADRERPGNAPSTVIGLDGQGSLVIHRSGAIAPDRILEAWSSNQVVDDGPD